MKPCILIIATMISAGGLAPAATTATTAHAAHTAAVETSLSTWVRGPQLRKQIADTLDLPMAEDAGRLTIGPRLRMQSLNARLLVNGRSLADAVEPGENWRFMLLLDGETVGMATVEPNASGSLAIVDIGARQLAEQVSALARQQPGNTPIAVLRSREAMRDTLAFGTDPAKPAFYMPIPRDADTHAEIIDPAPSMTAATLAATLRMAIGASNTPSKRTSP